jgi:hypothetical protein
MSSNSLSNAPNTIPLTERRERRLDAPVSWGVPTRTTRIDERRDSRIDAADIRIDAEAGKSLEDMSVQIDQSNRFTEGFDTADLKEKALLDQLGQRPLHPNHVWTYDFVSPHFRRRRLKNAWFKALHVFQGGRTRAVASIVLTQSASA